MLKNAVFIKILSPQVVKFVKKRHFYTWVATFFYYIYPYAYYLLSLSNVVGIKYNVAFVKVPLILKSCYYSVEQTGKTGFRFAAEGTIPLQG
jgi:hypothetical protein